MSKTKALVLSGVLGLVALALFLVFIVKILSDAGGGSLGDETFDANASTLARLVKRDGPILFPDLLGKGKDIYIQHLSEETDQGWLAFRATAPGANRPCTLVWERAEQVFRDPCSPTQTYPPDGQGLEQFQAAVQGANKLVVNLKQTIP